MSFFGSRRQTDLPPTPTQQRPEQPQKPAPVPQPVGFETVIGASCTLEGALKSGANVRLDGTFTGTLEISGNVLVGETAKINADINARNISIAGAVRGNVSGRKVQLLRTGRIWGDIRAQALTTEEGAFIDGKITIMTQETTPEPATAASTPTEITVPEAMLAAAQVAPAAKPQAEVQTPAEMTLADDGGPVGAVPETQIPYATSHPDQPVTSPSAQTPDQFPDETPVTP